jgi:hypothetical protein
MVNLLQLGDIVRIVSPKWIELHNATCFIHYYDPNDFMELVNVSSLKTFQISLRNGKWNHQSHIEKLVLLNRSIHKGFARQNGLLPNTWVDLEFSGDVRSVIVAQIVHLEEDMIELSTFPERDVLYIDFAYKGIPKELPLKHLCICNEPASYQSAVTDEPKTEKFDETIELDDREKVVTEYNALGEMLMEVPNEVVLEDDYTVTLHNEYVQSSHEASDLVEVDSYVQQVEVVRYGIDAQINFLLDDFLSIIPDEKRSRDVMKQIYIHLNRFKELRDNFSTKDEYDQITGFITHDPKHYKPLIEQIYQMKQIPNWIVPVSNVLQHLYLDNIEVDYNAEKFNDTLLFHLPQSINQEQQYEKTLFTNNTLPYHGETNKYANLYSTLNREIYTPHSILKDAVLEPLARDLEIFQDIDMILGHNRGYRSTSVIQDEDSSPIFIQSDFKSRRFLSEIMYSRFINKQFHESAPLMDADRVHLQSLIFLPKHRVNQCQLLYGNVLNQTKYQAPYLSSLLKHTDHIENEINIQSTDDRSTVLPLESAWSHNIMGPVENVIHNPVLANPQFHTFLQSTLPNTYSLIEHYYSDNADKYNILDYLDTFSPYGIHMDNLSFTSYRMIRKHLLQNIDNYTADYSDKREDFVQYALAKFKMKQSSTSITHQPFLMKYFMENATFQSQIKQLYNLDDTLVSDQFQRVTEFKNGRLFFMYILLLNESLITPTNIVDPFTEPTPIQHGQRKIIAKKYTALRDMQDDNSKRDLRFDSEYDTNDYQIILKYRKEISTLPPDQFLEFLIQKLSMEYNCSSEQVAASAEELLQGYKLVKEDDYALLELKPHLPTGVEECSFNEKEKGEIVVEAEVHKVQKFFKRVNHIWIYDPDVSEDSFIKPQELSCIVKTPANKVTAQEQQIFKNQYGEDMDTIVNNIKQLIVNATTEMEMDIQLRKQKQQQYDKQSVKLGNMAYISESLPSKNQPLLDSILHKSQSIEDRYENIVSFGMLYCREALEKEDPGWKYCNDSETSIPLLPLALHELAVAFQNNTYLTMLSYLVKNKKIKYEDGRYVLVHGGYILEEIEFSDQGMELAMELDENDTWDYDSEIRTMDTHYEVHISSGKKKYNSSKLRIVYNVLSAISKTIFVPFDRIEDSAMTLCMDFVQRKDIFIGKDMYDRKMEKKHKGGKYPSYEIFENTMILDMTTCCLTIALQSMVPSYEPRKSAGSCVKILDGYPLNLNSGQEGTIIYMACVLRKMQGDKKTLPWSTISKTTNSMETRIKTMFDMILKDDKVSRLLQEKRDYITTIREIVPKDNNMKTSWSHFLPPLINCNVLNGKTPLRNVEKTAHEMLKKTLKSGSHDQWTYLGMYFGKTLSFSFGLQEVINEIVREKGSLLEKYGKVPWLENACCNQMGHSSNPMVYFSTEDARVTEYNKSVQQLGTLLEKTRLYIRSPFLHIEKLDNPFEISTPVLMNYCHFSETMIYRTFIHYLSLDSSVKPIPNHLESFLKLKYEDYNPRGAIEEKIAFLKDKGNSVNATVFQSLMTLTHRENRVKHTPVVSISYHETVVNTLTNLQTQFQVQNDPVVDNSTINQFTTFFNEYINRNKIGQIDDIQEGGEKKKEIEQTPQQLQDKLLDQLENFIIKETDKMKDKIRSSFANIGIMKDKIEKFLNVLSFSSLNNSVHYTELGMFTKNYLYYLCVLVPTYIIHGAKMDRMSTKTILMPRDRKKVESVLQKKYAYLNEFVKDDIMTSLLNTTLTKLKTFYMFLREFQGFFPTSRETLYIRYFRFSLIFVFYYLIHVTEDENVLHIIFKHVQQKEAQESADTFLDLDPDEDVETIELQAADKGTVLKQVWKFVHTLMDSNQMFYRDQTELLLPYSEVQRNVDRLKELEKIKVMARFDPKNVPDHRTRRAEKDLKKFHLGQYYTNQTVINTYGTRRDKMLNTDDLNEKDILYRNDDVYDATNDALDLFGDENELNYDTQINDNGGIFEDEDEDDEGEDDDDYEEEIFMKQRYEDDDNYDIAENAADRM